MPLPTLPPDTNILNCYIKINCSNSSILFPKFLIFESFTPLKLKVGSLELFTLQKKVWFVMFSIYYKSKSYQGPFHFNSHTTPLVEVS